MPKKIASLYLKKSPLVLVLAQVRFSPILKMSDYVPEIQEKLRHTGYPRFRSQQTHEVVFGPEPHFRRGNRWVFLNKDQSEAAILANSFVVMETNKYDSFEGFSSRFGLVLGEIGDILNPMLCDRLGLRYVNLIRPQLEENTDTYLQPRLLGLRPNDLGIQKLLNQFESQALTPMGQLVIRLHQNDKGMFLPPDLAPGSVTFDLRIPPESTITLLDIDHFSEKDRDFERHHLIDELWSLHEYNEKAFLASVTETALERWNQESGA